MIKMQTFVKIRSNFTIALYLQYKPWTYSHFQAKFRGFTFGGAYIRKTFCVSFYVSRFLKSIIVFTILVGLVHASDIIWGEMGCKFTPSKTRSTYIILSHGKYSGGGWAS